MKKLMVYVLFFLVITTGIPSHAKFINIDANIVAEYSLPADHSYDEKNMMLKEISEYDDGIENYCKATTRELLEGVVNNKALMMMAASSDNSFISVNTVKQYSRAFRVFSTRPDALCVLTEKQAEMRKKEDVGAKMFLSNLRKEFSEICILDTAHSYIGTRIRFQKIQTFYWL